MLSVADGNQGPVPRPLVWAGVAADSFHGSLAARGHRWCPSRLRGLGLLLGGTVGGPRSRPATWPGSSSWPTARGLGRAGDGAAALRPALEGGRGSAARSSRLEPDPLMPGAQYCTGIGQRKVHHPTLGAAAIQYTVCLVLKASQRSSARGRLRGRGPADPPGLEVASTTCRACAGVRPGRGSCQRSAPGQRIGEGPPG
jgi:hypothetical protein